MYVTIPYSYNGPPLLVAQNTPDGYQVVHEVPAFPRDNVEANKRTIRMVQGMINQSSYYEAAQKAIGQIQPALFGTNGWRPKDELGNTSLSDITHDDSLDADRVDGAKAWRQYTRYVNTLRARMDAASRTGAEWAYPTDALPNIRVTLLTKERVLSTAILPENSFSER
jgi:hypothetical protein